MYEYGRWYWILELIKICVEEGLKNFQDSYDGQYCCYGKKNLGVDGLKTIKMEKKYNNFKDIKTDLIY